MYVIRFEWQESRIFTVVGVVGVVAAVVVSIVVFLFIHDEKLPQPIQTNQFFRSVSTRPQPFSKAMYIQILTRVSIDSEGNEPVLKIVLKFVHDIHHDLRSR